MRTPEPVTLDGHGVRLEPLSPDHLDGLVAAAADGKLWELWFTSVPAPTDTLITSRTHWRDNSRATCCPGQCGISPPIPLSDLPAITTSSQAWSGLRLATPGTRRVGSGAMSIAPASSYSCPTPSIRSDANWWASGPTISTSAPNGPLRPWGRRKTASCAITSARRDGTVRDSVMYSILTSEWPPVRRHLVWRLNHARSPE